MPCSRARTTRPSERLVQSGRTANDRWCESVKQLTINPLEFFKTDLKTSGTRTAIAGRDLDRQDREPSLRLSRPRRRGNGIRALDGANARAAGERQHEGPGHCSIGRKLVLKARQLLQAEIRAWPAR